MMKRLIEEIKQNPRLKEFVLNLMIHPVKTRPRLWLRLFQFIYLKRGKGSVIYRSVRKDLVPFNRFSLGKYAVVESFSTLNNAVGDIIIGEHTRIGLGNILIGPVQIGDYVNLAQNIVISGLNHNYEDIHKNIAEQGVTTSPVLIDQDVWIGANCSIRAGIHIGKHAVIGAGSVVTKDIPDYSVAVGNPARVIKRYDFEKGVWTKTE